MFSRGSKGLAADPYGAPTAGVSTDVLIIGDGVIGLSIACELARSGATFVLVGARRAGAASVAAAGLLAPSIGRLPDAARPFFDDSLCRYPLFVEALRPFEPALAMVQGLIDVSSETNAAGRTGRQLSAAELATLESSVGWVHGARFHAGDGAIDNALLVRALRWAAEVAPHGLIVTDDPVLTIDLSGNDPAVLLRSGTRLTARSVVLAAGAWTAAIDGLPRRVPVTPLKGQMLALASSCLTHPVVGDDVYLVPRGCEIAVGATEERAGFDVRATPEAIDRLREAAVDICPPLKQSRVTRTWAGIRPVSPDMLPIIGYEPADHRLIYACGHAKNGILLAPATGAAVAALAQRCRPAADLAPFSIMRFA